MITNASTLYRSVWWSHAHIQMPQLYRSVWWSHVHTQMPQLYRSVWWSHAHIQCLNYIDLYDDLMLTWKCLNYIDLCDDLMFTHKCLNYIVDLCDYVLLTLQFYYRGLVVHHGLLPARSQTCSIIQHITWDDRLLTPIINVSYKGIITSSSSSSSFIRKRQFLPRYTRVRRLPIWSPSTHPWIPPFRMWTKHFHVIIHTLGPSLPAPTLTYRPWRPNIFDEGVEK